MLLSDFDYNLPKELIAQEPIEPRDQARLLVLSQDGTPLEHLHFYDLPRFLKSGDVLVFNDTKVFKARLLGTICARHSDPPAGGEESLGQKQILLRPASWRTDQDDVKRAEIFLLRPIDEKHWEVLLKPGKKLQVGSEVEFAEGLQCVIKEKPVNGPAVAEFNQTKKKVLVIAEKIGHVPIPPYIKKEPARADDYQTVYARYTGSVAAPTAGFHFT